MIRKRLGIGNIASGVIILGLLIWLRASGLWLINQRDWVLSLLAAAMLVGGGAIVLIFQQKRRALDILLVVDIILGGFALYLLLISASIIS